MHHLGRQVDASASPQPSALANPPTAAEIIAELKTRTKTDSVAGQLEERAVIPIFERFASSYNSLAANIRLVEHSQLLEQCFTLLVSHRIDSQSLTALNTSSLRKIRDYLLPGNERPKLAVRSDLVIPIFSFSFAFRSSTRSPFESGNPTVVW